MRKFIYADDIGLVAQEKFFELKETLKKYLKILQNYFKKWYLNLNNTKTITVVFHLNNRETNKELKLKIDKINISKKECPGYLGIKLDRLLTFRHLDTIKSN